MSDLQDLIHTNAHNAYEIGVRTERERIIQLLKNTLGDLGIQRQFGSYVFATDLETIIRGDHGNISK